MCRFLRLRPGKSPSPRLRSQRLSRASVSDRNRKLLPDHLTPFVIYERVRCAAAKRGFLSRPAGPFLPGTVARILVRARRRAVRCCRLADGYREGDARYKARCRFQMRSAVAGATRLVSAATQARTNRDARSKDRRLVFAASVKTRVETSTAAPMRVTRPEFSICRPIKRIVPIAHVANPQKAVGVTDNLGKRSHD